MPCEICGSEEMDEELKNVCKECAKAERKMWSFYSRKIEYNGKLITTG